jgi:hypothetical protein
MKKTWIFVKRGLSEDPKHRAKMGECIWFFLHLCDMCDWETGMVYDWKDDQGASEMTMQVSTVRYQRRKLQEAGYITAIKKQRGQDLIIHNWTNPREYSGAIKNPKILSDNKLPVTEILPGSLPGSSPGSSPGSLPKSQITGLPLDSSSSSSSPLNAEQIQKIKESADQAVDNIIENERKVKGRQWTNLPEIYHQFGKTFQDFTGIIYTKKQAFDWMSEFDEWLKAGFKPEDVERAIRSIQADGKISISRPGSITWKLRAQVSAAHITAPAQMEYRAATQEELAAMEAQKQTERQATWEAFQAAKKLRVQVPA